VISARQIDHITQILRRQVDTALPKLRAACDEANATQLNSLAHSLKGAALEVGLPQIAELARIIEAAGREMEGHADRQALLVQVNGAIEAIPAALARSLQALDKAREPGPAA
jgi:HPt (histidine-containing phosphotransfer) domain-containing protein